MALIALGFKHVIWKALDPVGYLSLWILEGESIVFSA
jgi:hypothetical protein